MHDPGFIQGLVRLTKEMYRLVFDVTHGGLTILWFPLLGLLGIAGSVVVILFRRYLWPRSLAFILVVVPIVIVLWTGSSLGGDDRFVRPLGVRITERPVSLCRGSDYSVCPDATLRPRMGDIRGGRCIV